MTKPQSGLIPDASTHALFLTFLLEGSGAAAHCREVAAQIPRMTDDVAAQDGGDAVTSVFAVGAAAWDRLYAGGRPDGLTAFQALADNGRMAPATPADLFLHVRGDRFDLCFEPARRVRAQLGEAVRVVEDIHGFRYRDSRDLTGFVDGTENPKGEDNRRRAALVGEGTFAGGSYLDIQRYVHDLAKWGRVDTSAQENVIGRTKADDVEFDRDRLPATAHISRVSIQEDGKSLAILRHSMPYGTTDEHGLYFVAYAARPDTFARMLRRMFVAGNGGHYDHLLDYTRAVTGASFFAPSRDWLERHGG